MKARVPFTIAIVAVMLSLMPVPAAAQRSSFAQIRAVCVRFGCTPVQFRQVMAFIDSNSAQITNYARMNRVNQNAFRAMAIELGARNVGTDPQALLRAIQDRAADAVRYESENAQLRQQLAAITAADIRRPAELALARADAAYAAGDLDTAQATLEELVDLRTSELTTARTAWETATQSAISLAAARGDRERLERLVDTADTYLADQQNRTRHQRWENRMTQADAAYDQGYLRGDNQALIEAIHIYRESALPLAPRATAPAAWTTTQIGLADALTVLGDRESGTARLEDAVNTYRLALTEQTRERVPLDWAQTQQSLAHALVALGERESGTARLREAITVLRLALTEQTHERVPLVWARTQMGLAAALGTLGERESGTARLEESVTTFRLALTEQTRERVPLDWAWTQMNLGNTLSIIGERESGTRRLLEAETAYRLALVEYTRQRVPLDWAQTQGNLGTTLAILGERESGTTRLDEAVTAFRLALTELTRERTPLDWARIQSHLTHVLAVIAVREGNEE